jgi:hypothetical protein
MGAISGKDMRILLITIGVVLAVIFGAALKPADKTAAPLVPTKATAANACYMAEVFVEQRLKAPATAKHPWCSEAVVSETGENEFLVVSYVDSQNSFGALIRTKYAAKVRFDKYDEKRNQLWTLVDIAMKP